MIGNSIPYFSFTSLIFLLFLLSQAFNFNVRVNRNFSILSSYLLFCLVVFFLGLRGYIGADWVFYYPYYERAPVFFDKGILFFFQSSNYGVGYGFWNVLIKTFGLNYLGFQFVNVIFHFFILDSIFRYYCGKHFILAWFFFFCFNGLDIEILYLRNSTTIYIFIYSLRYVDRKNFCKYIFFNFIGLLFHTSALIYFPLYIFLRIKRNKKIELFFFILGVLIFLLKIQWLKLFLSRISPFLPLNVQILIKSYMLSVEFSSAYSFSLGMFERFFSFFILFVNSDKIILHKPELKNFYFLFLLYMGTYLYCSEFGIFIARMTVLVIPCYWILLPNLYFCITKGWKKIFLLTYVLYSSLRVFNAMQIDWAFYENILTGISSMAERKRLYFPK